MFSFYCVAGPGCHISCVRRLRQGRFGPDRGVVPVKGPPREADGSTGEVIHDYSPIGGNQDADGSAAGQSQDQRSCPCPGPLLPQGSMTGAPPAKREERRRAYRDVLVGTTFIGAAPIWPPA